jgi:type IV secretion system protein VirB1
MIALPDIAACTPANVAPQTVAAIIQVESGGDPLAVHINFADGTGVVFVPQNLAQGVAVAAAALQQGNSVDIGLMQINSANIARLGYTLNQMFDPCTNIKAGATILTADYSGALAVAPAGQKALAAALSAYNTGNYRSGFSNGYVAHYYGGSAVPSGATPANEPNPNANPLTADTSVFHRSGNDEPNFTQSGSFANPAASQWPSQSN